MSGSFSFEEAFAPAAEDDGGFSFEAASIPLNENFGGDILTALDSGATVAIPKQAIGIGRAITRGLLSGDMGDDAISEQDKKAFVSSAEEAVFGGMSKAVDQRGANLREEYTPASKQALAAKWTGDNENFAQDFQDSLDLPGMPGAFVPETLPGEAMEDWGTFGRKAVLGVAESLPGTVVTMGPTMAISRKAGIAAMERAAALTQDKALIAKAGEVAAERAAMLAGGTSEGMQGGGAAYEQTLLDVRKTHIDDDLRQNQAFKDALAATDKTTPIREREKVALDMIAHDAALISGAGAFAVDSVFGAIGDRYIGSASMGGGGRLGSVSKGMLQEAPTEAIQSGGEKFSENLALQQTVNPEQDLSAGVFEEGVGGGIVGGLSGGIMGGALYRSAPSAPDGQPAAQQESAPPTAAQSQPAAPPAEPIFDPEQRISEIETALYDGRVTPEEITANRDALGVDPVRVDQVLAAFSPATVLGSIEEAVRAGENPDKVRSIVPTELSEQVDGAIERGKEAKAADAIVNIASAQSVDDLVSVAVGSVTETEPIAPVNDWEQKSTAINNQQDRRDNITAETTPGILDVSPKVAAIKIRSNRYGQELAPEQVAVLSDPTPSGISDAIFTATMPDGRSAYRVHDEQGQPLSSWKVFDPEPVQPATQATDQPVDQMVGQASPEVATLINEATSGQRSLLTDPQASAVEPVTGSAAVEDVAGGYGTDLSAPGVEVERGSVVSSELPAIEAQGGLTPPAPLQPAQDQTVTPASEIISETLSTDKPDLYTLAQQHVEETGDYTLGGLMKALEVDIDAADELQTRLKAEAASGSVDVNDMTDGETQRDLTLTGETQTKPIIQTSQPANVADQQLNQSVEADKTSDVSSQESSRLDYGTGSIASPAAIELRGKSYPKQQNENDVFLGSSDNYVKFEDAEALAREALGAGVTPMAFPISNALDIAPGYAKNVLEAAKLLPPPRPALSTMATQDNTGELIAPGAREEVQPTLTHDPENDSRYYGTRVLVAGEVSRSGKRISQDYEGTVQRTYISSSGETLMDVIPDGKESSFRVNGGRVKTVSLVDNAVEGGVEPKPSEQQTQRVEISGKFAPGTREFNATPEGQQAMASRGRRVAMLTGLNKAVGSPYSDVDIENIPDSQIDSVRDSLIDQQRVTPAPPTVKESLTVQPQPKRKPEPLEFQGDEFGGMAQPIKQLVLKAKEFAKRTFADKTVTNASDSSDIIIPWQGIKHALSGSVSKEAAIVTARLGEVIERGTFVRDEADKTGRGTIKRALFYTTDVSIGGVPMSMEVVVREHHDGKRYYDHYTIKEKTPDGMSGEGRNDQSIQPRQGSAEDKLSPTQDNINVGDGVVNDINDDANRRMPERTEQGEGREALLKDEQKREYIIDGWPRDNATKGAVLAAIEEARAKLPTPTPKDGFDGAERIIWPKTRTQNGSKFYPLPGQWALVNRKNTAGWRLYHRFEQDGSPKGYGDVFDDVADAKVFAENYLLGKTEPQGEPHVFKGKDKGYTYSIPNSAYALDNFESRIKGSTGVKFSKATADDQTANLYVAHNISTRGIRHILDLGGMAAPSLAVASVDGSPYTSYGEITLLASPSILESNNASVFDADIYSPRYPSAINTVNSAKFNELLKWASDDNHKLSQLSIDSIEDSRDHAVLMYKDSIKYAWLRDQGKAPKISKSPDFNLYKAISEKFRNKKVEAAFEKWAVEKFNELVESKRIFKGYTNSGKRRYIPYTLDNILKEMTATLRGGEGFNYGAGNIRAAFAKKFRGMADIKKNRGRVISSEEFSKIKEESQDKLSDLLDYLKPYYRFSADSFGYMNDASSAIAEGYKGLREAFDLDAEARGKINEYIEYLKNLPTEYFEAKVQRVVRLQEFDAAIVPKGTDEDIVKALERRGIDVKFYKEGDADARLKLVRKTATLFSKSAPSTGTTPQQITAEISTHLGASRTEKLMARTVRVIEGQAEAKRLVAELEADLYSIRESPPPAKVIKAYKLFKVKKSQPGKLFPLYINATEEVPIGQWLDADIGDNKKAGLALRPGWHMGDSPMATHIGGKAPGAKKSDPPSFREYDTVWAEVEVSDDVDWQSEVNARADVYKTGPNKGKIVPKTAELKDQIPTDGNYRYKTNSNMTGSWVIGGAIKVNRILSDAEVAEINSWAGVKDLPRRDDQLFNPEEFGFAVKYSKTGAIQGFSDGKNIYLVSSGIQSGKAWPVLLHEITHHTRLNIKSKPQWQALLDDIDARTGEDSDTGRALAEAEKRIPADTPANLRSEEKLAYLIEQGSDVGIVRRFIAMVKQWLVKMGISPSILNAADFRALAVNAARGVADARGGASESLESVQFSKSATATNDGLLAKISGKGNVDADNAKTAKRAKAASQKFDKDMGDDRATVNERVRKKVDLLPGESIIATAEYTLVKTPAGKRMIQAAERRAMNKVEYENYILDGTIPSSQWNEDELGPYTDHYHQTHNAFIESLEALNPEDKATWGGYLLEMDRSGKSFRIKNMKGYEVKTPDGRYLGMAKDMDEVRNIIKTHHQSVKGHSNGLFMKDYLRDKTDKWMVIGPKGEQISAHDDERNATQAMMDAEGDSLGKDGKSAPVIEAVRIFREMTNRAFDLEVADLRKVIAEREELGLPPLEVQVPDERKRWAIKDKRGKILVTYEEEEQALNHIRELSKLKAGFSKVKPVRQSDLEIIGPASLQDYIAAIGDLRGSYFPRQRSSGGVIMTAVNKQTGDKILEKYDLFITKGTKYDSETGRAMIAPETGEEFEPGKLATLARGTLNYLTPLGRRIRALEKQGYTLSIDKEARMPETIFAAAHLSASITAMMDESLANVEGKASPAFQAAYAEIHKQMAGSLADFFKQRGALSSRMKRASDYYSGFEEDPLKAGVQYAKGKAGGIAKRLCAQEITLAMTGRDIPWKDWKEENPEGTWEEYSAFVNDRKIDPKEQPNMLSEALSWTKEVLRNDEQSDRLMGTLKGLAVLKYLGFRVSSAAVNMTNLVQAVPATIASVSGGNISSAIGEVTRSLGVLNSYRTGKASDIDSRIFSEISEKGWDSPQFNHEAASVLRSKQGNRWAKFTDASMWMFGKVEQINRAATIHAAYKQIQKNKPGMKHADLMVKAHEVSNDAHGVYGKETAPVWTRGAYNPLKLTWTFLKFSQNYMLLTKKMIGKGDLKEAVWMLLSPMILGGAGASVITPLVATILQVAGIGGDDPEEELYKWARERFGGDSFARHGLPGIIGINIKGSLQVNNPFPTKIEELFGAPGSLFFDMRDAYRETKKGAWSKAAEKFFPTAMVAPFKAAREYGEGLTTASYSRIYDADEPLKATGYDSVLRALSFNPSGPSGVRERQYREAEVAKKYMEAKKNINSKIKKAWLEGDEDISQSDWVDLTDDIEAYNERAESSGIADVTPITKKSIKMMLDRNAKPSKREKAKTK